MREQKERVNMRTRKFHSIQEASVALSVASLIVFGATAPSAFAGSKAPTKNPYGTVSIDPAAPGTPVLSLTKGAITKSYTLAQLEKMATKSITIYEPFLKVKQSFSVISLASLFKVVGIKATDSVVTTALNDYVYTNTGANFLAANGYLAVKRNGLDIPYDQGGPDRIIFPTGSKWSKFLDPWNWSLSSISVK